MYMNGRYDLSVIGAMLYQLNYEAIYVGCFTMLKKGTDEYVYIAD